jgi:hypothetical protein
MGGSLQFIAMRRLFCFPYILVFKLPNRAWPRCLFLMWSTGPFAERNFSTFILFHCFWAFLLFIQLYFQHRFVDLYVRAPDLLCPSGLPRVDISVGSKTIKIKKKKFKKKQKKIMQHKIFRFVVAWILVPF